MATSLRQRVAAGVLGALVLCTAPAVAQVDALTEFNRLEKQFDQDYDAARYRDAELTAQRMRELAEGPLRGRPGKLSMAVRRQGIAIHEQGRNAEAEAMYRWCLQFDEELYGRESDQVAVDLNNLGTVCKDLGRFNEAETYYRGALAIWERILKPGARNIGSAYQNLGDLYEIQGRYLEAEQACKRALAIVERQFGADHVKTASVLNNLANVYMDMARYAPAELLHKQALAIREKSLGPEHPDVATSLNNLGVLYGDLGRYVESEAVWRRALEISTKAHGLYHADVALRINNLGCLYVKVACYAEAEESFRHALSIREKILPPGHPDFAQSFHNLGLLCEDLGRHAEAEPFHKQALAIYEKAFGAESPAVADTLNNLAGVYRHQTRYGEAEELYKRALEIRKKAFGPLHPDVAEALGNLGALNDDQGRYADCETYTRQELAIFLQHFPPDHPRLCIPLNHLALNLSSQGYNRTAEKTHELVLAIQEKVYGPDHPDVATTLSNLANAKTRQDRDAEAEALHRRALAIRQKVFPSGHPDVAGSLHNLAMAIEKQGRDGEAEDAYRHALAIKEKFLGQDHPRVASTLNNLGWLYEKQGRHDDAAKMADRAVAIYERRPSAPCDQAHAHHLRAQVAWKTGRRTEALADMEKAMHFAEVQRARSSGREADRAWVFGGYADVFAWMALWQAEMGNFSEALDAIERSRARSMVDQMAARGIDLRAGVPEQEANSLEQRKREAQISMAKLEQDLAALERRQDLSAEARDEERKKLQAQLGSARFDHVTIYAEIHSASPAYRLALGKDHQAVTLERLSKWVAQQDALFLEYVLGEEGSFVLVVPGRGEPRLEKLLVTEDLAPALETQAGPLTVVALYKMLANDRQTGVLQPLRGAKEPANKDQLAAAMTAMWRLLIPVPERAALTEGRFKRLIVVPDGPLAQLPFETLTVDQAGQETVLLDVGPPVLYAPSATILLNLADRPVERIDVRREPVLAVGNPRYTAPGNAAEGLLAQITTRAQYIGAVGRFPPLPHTAWEIAWLAEVFGRKQIPVALLKEEEATEAAVRSNASGRRILHLACHGFTDQAYRNFFGALALAAGPNPEDPSDDGFLSLTDIYQLNLKGCELAILSACDTNVGPELRGEGVWALSRGFLVAGSRRVVASNWLVDDEAAASLMSYFYSILAKAAAAGEKPDYAEALWKAKRWLRSQEQWQSPYYWGSFVLIGPN